MNIRKNIDYSEMYAALDQLMAQQLPQMELYCAIGKAVCQRTEKGSAVMASEYLNMRYPDAKGFSPRSLRRIRDFYRTYENHPALLSHTMELGWIQNVVIMEAELTMELREWYIKAAKQLKWIKTQLVEKIKSNIHEEIVLDIGQEMCDNIRKPKNGNTYLNTVKNLNLKFRTILTRRRCRGQPRRGAVPWRTMWFPIFTEKRIVFMRC